MRNIHKDTFSRRSFSDVLYIVLNPNLYKSLFNFQMFPHNVKPKTNFIVDETLQTALHLKIDDFIADETQKTLSFPASLTHIERGYIHKHVARKGLISKSTGNG